MIRGPKTELILERYTDADDGGGGQTRTWEGVKRLKGVMVYIHGIESKVRGDREAVRASHMFFCPYVPNLNITEKDRFMKVGYTNIWDIVYVDNMLEQNKWLKIEILKVV